jgi:hypothetical protein
MIGSISSRTRSIWPNAYSVFFASSLRPLSKLSKTSLAAFRFCDTSNSLHQTPPSFPGAQ